MTLAFVLMFLAWIIALVECTRLQRGIQSERRFNGIYRDVCAQYRKQNDAAMKQIAALRGQSPGRDKSGRFVKTPKGFDNHGSE